MQLGQSARQDVEESRVDLTPSQTHARYTKLFGQRPDQFDLANIAGAQELLPEFASVRSLPIQGRTNLGFRHQPVRLKDLIQSFPRSHLILTDNDAVL